MNVGVLVEMDSACRKYEPWYLSIQVFFYHSSAVG